MAKRMFNSQIIDSDAFLDMGQGSQLLYFHLGMRCDDDGFVGNVKRLMRTVGVNEDDLKVLIGKSFIIPFESGVVVIKHHRMNNNWDTYNCKRTVYADEFDQLYIKENKAYTLDKNKGIPVQTVHRLETVGFQSVEEKRREENRIEENNKESADALPTPSEKATAFFDMVNSGDLTDFIRNMNEKTGLDTGTIKTELKKFTSHWTELTKSGKKQRWQLEPTFEVQRRLATWFSNAQKWSREKAKGKGIV